MSDNVSQMPLKTDFSKHYQATQSVRVTNSKISEVDAYLLESVAYLGSRKGEAGEGGGASLDTHYVGRDSIPVRRPDSQSREPGFKSHCGRFEPLASLITPRCHSSLSCINEYLAIQTVVDM